MGTVTPPALNEDAACLVQEFQAQVPGLTEADAYRSAFAVFALRLGWSKAKIGRYLGISRARVGQRIDRCQEYARGDAPMPVLRRLLLDVEEAAAGPDDVPVSFAQDDWKDLAFARSMLNQVAERPSVVEGDAAPA